jgi:2',3'-cyclic-nucleotide 2'-phosphodiesterase (5'-nucleotidase family)
MSIIASTNSGYIYTSINGGTTWSLVTSIADTPRTWQSVALSGDGTKAIATTNPGQVYTSTDGQIFTPYNLANTTTTDGTTLKYIMKW